MRRNDNDELRKSVLLNNLLNSINSNHVLCVFYSEDLVNICSEAKINGFDLNFEPVDKLLDELDAFEKSMEDIKPFAYCEDNNIEHFFELNNKICSLSTTAISLINIYLNEYLNNVKASNNEELVNKIKSSELMYNVPNYSFKDKFNNLSDDKINKRK